MIRNGNSIRHIKIIIIRYIIGMSATVRAPESREWSPHPSMKHIIETHSVPDHPVAVSESANMAATPLPPLQYELHPSVVNIASHSVISSLQLETASYAAQAITRANSGKAFFLGDATGVGKTRTTIAAILDRVAKSRDKGAPGFKVLWVSCRLDLEKDVLNTLRAMESQTGVNSAMKWSKYTDLRKTRNSRRNSKLSSEDSFGDLMFITYGALRTGISGWDTSNASMLNGVIKWIDGASESIIVFDEAHVSKTPSSSTHAGVCILQNCAPRSGIIYCTATAASDIGNLSYMTRLGLFGEYDGSPFFTHSECCRCLRKGGPSALEMVALHLKSRGLYVSRVLKNPSSAPPMHGPPITVRISPQQRNMYNSFCDAWVNRPTLNRHPMYNTMKQSFFLRLMTSFKAQGIIPYVRSAVSEGWSVVISMQNTGDGKGSTSCKNLMDTCEVPTSGCFMPYDALDILILELHRAQGIGPVAEITGRRGRMEHSEDGAVVQVSRTSKQIRQEVSDFQSGAIKVAILTAAGGTGMSLHATQASSKRRLHIMLELPWSSEALVQQCGRTHRTGETVPPLYRIVTLDVPADQRVAHTVSKRLESLGALSRGDRNHQQVHPGIRSVDLTTSVLHTAGVEVIMRETQERFNQLASMSRYSNSCKANVSRQYARSLFHIGNGWNHNAIVKRISETLSKILTSIDDFSAGIEDLKKVQGTGDAVETLELRLEKQTYELIMTYKSARVLLPDEEYDNSNTKWSRSTHHMFSKRKRDIARTIWLCARTPSRGNRFAAIIDDVLDIIITKVLDDGWNHSPSLVVKGLERAGIRRADLIKGTIESPFSSRFCAVPVEIQQTFWTAIHRASESQSAMQMVTQKPGDPPAAPRGATSIVSHCFPCGTMPGCYPRCLGVYVRSTDPCRVVVEVDAHPLSDPARVANEAFYEELSNWRDPCHARNGVTGLYYTQGSYGVRVAVRRKHASESRSVAWDIEVYSPGVVDPTGKVTEDNWAFWKDQNVVDIPSCVTARDIQAQWDKESNTMHKKRATKCAKSRVSVELLTAKRALYEWDNTTGVLVRGEPPFLPSPLIGVVVSTRRHHH